MTVTVNGPAIGQPGAVSGAGISEDVADWTALQAIASRQAACAGPRLRQLPGGVPGLRWRHDGTLWRLDGSQDILIDLTPSAGALSTSEQVVKQWAAIPANFLRSLRYIRVQVLWSKSGTTDAATNVRLRLGTAGTTADALLGLSSALIASNRSSATEAQLFAASATQMRAIARSSLASGTLAGFTGGGSTDVYPGNITVPDMSSNALTLSATMQMAGTTDTPTVAHLIVTGY